MKKEFRGSKIAKWGKKNKFVRVQKNRNSCLQFLSKALGTNVSFNVKDVMFANGSENFSMLLQFCIFINFPIAGRAEFVEMEI